VRVEPREHAGDGLLHELLVVHRLDVVGLDRAEHVGELADFLERDGALGVAERVGRNADTDQHAGDRADADQTRRTKPACHANLREFRPPV
jgi:hypothetical protein